MNYMFKTPSTLQRMVCVKIAAELWNQRDIRTEFVHFGHQIVSDIVIVEEFLNIWKELAQKVLEKLSALPSPERLKDLVGSVVEPMGLELLNWWKYHKKVSTDLVFPKELCWTLRGTIDCKKTAEALVKDEGLDIQTRYRLACIYCFESEIRDLWRRIPEEAQVEMEKAVSNLPTDNYRMSYMRNIHILVDFWTCTMCGGNEAQLCNLFRSRNAWSRSINHSAFKCATHGGNVVACEYFLDKLSGDRKDTVVLLDYALYVFCNYFIHSVYHLLHGDVDVACFLLNRMSVDQLEQVFQKKLYHVLCCLLNWPLQSLFLETATRWWRYMSTHDYAGLLQMISIAIHDSCKDCDYTQLFLTLWQLGPVDYKRHFIDLSLSYYIFALFEANGEEFVRVILKEATADQLVKLKHSIQCKISNILNQQASDHVDCVMNPASICRDHVTNCGQNVGEQLHMFLQLVEEHLQKQKDVTTVL